MVGKAKLQIALEAVDKASKEIKKTSKSLGTLDKASKDSSKALGSASNALQMLKQHAGLASIAVGALAIKFAKDFVRAIADFEQSMANVSTLIDTSTESMGEMSDAVLDISTRMPVRLDDLTSALYQVRSAGISAADSIDVLEIAAKLGVAGIGTTTEATNVLTSAINSFRLEGPRATQAANSLFLAVRAGKTTVSELSRGFGQVAGMAYEMGMSLEDLLATTSALTTTGMKASIAYSQIRAVLSNLLKQTPEMVELFKDADLSASTLTKTIGKDGLTSVIRRLTAASKGDTEQLAKAFGSVEALNSAMMLSGDIGETNIDIYDDMAVKLGALDEGFEKATDTAKAQWEILKHKLAKVMYELGSDILPALTDAMKELGPVIETTTKVFGWLISAMIKSGVEMFKLQAERIPALSAVLKLFSKKVEENTGWMIYWRDVTNLQMTSLKDLPRTLEEVIERNKEWSEQTRLSADEATKAIRDFRAAISKEQSEYEQALQKMIDARQVVVDRLGEQLEREISLGKEADQEYIKNLRARVQEEMTEQSKAERILKEIEERKRKEIASTTVAQIESQFEAHRAAIHSEYGNSDISWLPPVPTFQRGGIVPGPVNEPMPAIVHGGEEIIPADKKDLSGGNTYNFDFAGAYIGDIDAFKRQIINLINRDSELRALGGV